MLGHMYWMQGWGVAPPKALRNSQAWKNAGFRMLLWDCHNESALLPEGYEWPATAGPALRADVVIALAQAEFGGMALGADTHPLHPDSIIRHARTLQASDKGWVVWQAEKKRPYNDASWFPQGNEWIRHVAEHHRNLLPRLHGIEPKRMSPCHLTGPVKWKRLIEQARHVWKSSVQVLNGSEIFLREPRKERVAKRPWLDAGLTGDWYGTKPEVWQ